MHLLGWEYRGRFDFPDSGGEYDPVGSLRVLRCSVLYWMGVSSFLLGNSH